VNVTVLEASDRKLEARIDGTSVGQMNAIRRTIMAEVPCLAIEDVTIYDNKSALFDEVIAHRLGMLPVPTDRSILASWDLDEDPETQTEESTAEILYTLTYEGPGTVKAKDLKPASEDSEAEIAEPETPIVKLGRDQRLMLEATAKLGTGQQHAKWQPVAAVGYQEVPTVEIGEGGLGVDPEDMQELERLAPEDAISFSGDSVEIHDEVEAHDFLYNVRERFDLENVEFGETDDSFILQFETDGSLTPEVVLREAISILDQKLEEVQEKASTLQ
jgi:DNA-directed RNA polymerase subunit D